MSISQGAALSAVAFQFAAALDAYEVEARRMIEVRRDLELYQAVSRRMDEMRLYATAFPELSVAWVELMIRHFELTHALWRLQQPDRPAHDLAQVQDVHGRAVAALQARLRHLLPRH